MELAALIEDCAFYTLCIILISPYLRRFKDKELNEERLVIAFLIILANIVRETWTW